MQGHNVLYISLEMAEERIAERIDANLMDMTIDDLHSIPKQMFENSVEKLKKKTQGTLVIKEYPTASIMLVILKDYSRNLYQKTVCS